MLWQNSQRVLLVDAENAFNSLNRKVALHNIYVCPALAIVLNNCYQMPSRLIVPGGGELLSKGDYARRSTWYGHVRPLNRPSHAQVE